MTDNNYYWTIINLYIILDSSKHKHVCHGLTLFNAIFNANTTARKPGFVANENKQNKLVVRSRDDERDGNTQKQTNRRNQTQRKTPYSK